MHVRVCENVRSSRWNGLKRVLAEPERVEPDRFDLELEHRLRSIPEYEGRVLRVIVKKQTNPIRVITCYFDRKVRGQL